MATTSFRAAVEKEGVNSFVAVPARVSRAFAAFAERGRIRVAGTLERHPVQATFIPTKRGGHRLYVNGGMRAAAGIEVGDRVTLRLRALGREEVGVPPDLARALARARLRKRFDELESTYRRELVRSIDAARSPKNRAARIEETLSHVRGERTQRPRPAVIDKPLWTCPKCGHPFVTKNMSHSCARHELDDVFRGKPELVRALFERFRALVDERGPTTMIVYRDGLAFMQRVRFARVVPKRDHIELAFWFTERDPSPRFTRIETFTTNAHVHRVRIHALDELDAAVRRWIDRSYHIGCREHLR